MGNGRGLIKESRGEPGTYAIPNITPCVSFLDGEVFASLLRTTGIDRQRVNIGSISIIDFADAKAGLALSGWTF